MNYYKNNSNSNTNNNINNTLSKKSISSPNWSIN